MSKKRVIAALLAIVFVFVLVETVQQIKENHNNHAITLYGNVDVRQVDLSFRVSGRLTNMNFDEGDIVKPNDLVASIEKDIYTESKNEAAARVESLTASLKNAELLLKRRDEIVKSGAVSDEDYNNALTNRDVTLANLKEAKAILANATTNLTDTDCFSPTDGTILTRIREPGTILSVGEPICTVSITSPVWIRAYAQEQDLGRIYPGMPAEIFTDTKGAPIYTGHVGFISPVAEFTPKTVETTSLRTELVYRLRIFADNPDRGLRQGMPVTVKLKLK